MRFDGSIRLTPANRYSAHTTVCVLGDDWAIVRTIPATIRLTHRLANGELSLKTGTHFRNGPMLLVAKPSPLGYWTLSVEICDFTFAVVADWKFDDAQRTLVDWIRTNVYERYEPIFNEYPMNGTFNRKCVLKGPPLIVYSCLTPKPIVR